MKKTNKTLTSFADHLDAQYGKYGSPERDKFEEEFEAFKLGVMIQELRKGQCLRRDSLLRNEELLRLTFRESKITHPTFGLLHL